MQGWVWVAADGEFAGEGMSGDRLEVWATRLYYGIGLLCVGILLALAAYLWIHPI